ncbi:MAG TPA: glycosyltransferase, partial [Thermodesulfobacteriota bacterium]|nr:glycosyltransferase [Thermodesulfobacteriota bacterium]
LLRLVHKGDVFLADNPKVSILINCKNGAGTIRRCLDGALAQTYPDFEIVFQDGGSSDGTLDIVRSYVRKNPDRIRLRAEPDSCGEEGFFRGLKSCHGDVLVAACADEELLPTAISWGIEQLRCYPDAGAVYGDVYVTDRRGNIVSTWCGRPFSLKGYLCREVDPPFAASFFRRKAVVDAGLFTRKWTWGIGEFEFWLRIAMKYPVYYVPGVVAKYTFDSNTMSCKAFLQDDTFVEPRKAFFDRFFAEPDLPEPLRGMKEAAVAGLHLFIGEVLRGLGQTPKAHLHLQRALEHVPNGLHLLELSHKLSQGGGEWDRETLRRHIRGHLAGLPPMRVAAYGAGGDFRAFLSSGVFDPHRVVAVVDNHRPEGELVDGVPVIREEGLGLVPHDMVVVTSSKWARDFRMSARRRGMEDGAGTPVV